MTAARYGHTATPLADGRILIAGGYTEHNTTASAELYDPVSGRFIATGDMTTTRGWPTATLLPDGRVLIAGGKANTTIPGGSGTDGVLASSELYDPATGTFTPTGNMTRPRMGHTATLLGDGRVLIAVGWSGSDRLSSAELYDPSNGTFSTTGNMTRAADADLRATLLPDGRVLMAACGALNEIYDPVTGTFSRTGTMTTVGCYGPTATLLTNGNVLLAGGDLYYPPASAGAELYDSSTGTFTPTEKMTNLRWYHTATLLPDGRVLIASGEVYPTALASAELFDPLMGTFSATGNMVTGRGLHTATLLNDGTVLIGGGVDNGEHVLASAELYRPPLLVPAPVLFSLSGDGRGQGAILHAGTNQVASPSNPAIAGETLEIYCTGLSDGSVIPPQVAIGGRSAEILFFGKAPGFSGLNQVNVRVPNGVVPVPTVPVRLTYTGRTSNEVTIGVR
jgi:galactose oxidase-like protein